MKTPLFLFGSGRCGSTLLQRAINAHADTVMYGEHEGFLAPLANAYFKLTRTEDIERFVYSAEAFPASIIQGPISDSKANICWINDFTREDVEQEFRALVLNILARGLDLEKVHWGFKEIRYRKGEHVLWFLDEMFPDNRKIVLVRHPGKTIASGILAWNDAEKLLNDPVDLRRIVNNRIAGWNDKYRFLMDHADTRPEHETVLRYEDLVENPKPHMEAIFAGLGLKCPRKAVRMFTHRVASTAKNPYRQGVSEIVDECLAKTTNQPFIELAAKFNYL